MHITFDELSPPVTKWGWTMRNVGRSWASIGSKVQVIGIVSPAWTVIGQASGLGWDPGTFGQDSAPAFGWWDFTGFSTMVETCCGDVAVGAAPTNPSKVRSEADGAASNDAHRRLRTPAT